MQLQNGRPTDTTGRLDKEIRTLRFFGQTGNRISENRPRGGIYDGGL